MDIPSILYSILTISGMGLIFGLGLGYAGKIFEVKEDEKIGLIRSALPGANCGGCGFSGCDALAAAIAKGEAKANACPVGGAKCTEEIAAIMSVEAEINARVASYIKCGGSFSKSTFRYDYQGLDDCRAVSMLAGGGAKTCAYGCLGNGSCLRSCEFDAITIVDGIARVDNDKCTACGMCIETCPRKLLELVPYDSKVRVACNSHDGGKVVRSLCTIGCIACKICEKACDYDAIHVVDNLAHVDYDKCVQCGECVKKCPTKVIRIVDESAENDKAAV